MMDKGYKNIWILFAVILCIIILGFYRSYFSLFPGFENISLSQHVHTLLFLLYFALLFIQPFLIKKGKFKLHRLIGKCTYVLVPLLAFSIFTVTKGQYIRELTLYPKSQCIANLIVPLPQLLLFVTLYILAMLHTKNTGYHMRYIIGTSIVLIGPGLGRIIILWLGLSFEQGVQFCFFVTEIILVGLILYDMKRGNKYKPYTVLLILFLLCHINWYFLPYSPAWQLSCGKFIQLFF